MCLEKLREDFTSEASLREGFIPDETFRACADAILRHLRRFTVINGVTFDPRAVAGPTTPALAVIIKTPLANSEVYISRLDIAQWVIYGDRYLARIAASIMCGIMQHYVERIPEDKHQLPGK